MSTVTISVFVALMQTCKKKICKIVPRIYLFISYVTDRPNVIHEDAGVYESVHHRSTAVQ